jgi:predicted helicase
MNKNLAQVFHFDLYGKREDKYNFLTENSLSTINWTELNPQAPEHFFVNKDFDAKSEYDEGFSVNELFSLNNVGVVTAKDGILINENSNDLLKNVSIYYQVEIDKKIVKKISYRPFDDRYVYFDTTLIERSREKVMQHFLKGENVGLALCKQFKTGDNYLHSFITNKIIESSYVSNRTSEITSILPLYLYPDEKNKDLFADGQTRIPNLNTEILNKIAAGLGLNFTPEPVQTKHALSQQKTNFAPIDILDYIYAVLHSPTYREKYREFLKIDFPRVPYPKDLTTFKKLSNLGSQIRQIHLLESPTVENYITQYPKDGNNVVVKPRYELTTEHAPLLGKVYINETQYFDNVPQIAWNFYIGGYQPAQKWLKDRKERTLEFDDILHYQKIIVALTETDRLMKEIDIIEIA